MDADRLRNLITLPESEVLEFKARLPDRQVIASVIASMANTRGGDFVIGVGDGGEVVGIRNPQEALLRLAEAAETISPQTNVGAEIVVVNGKPVLVAMIPKSHESPHFVDGQAFQRVGAGAVPLTSSAIYDSVRERAADRDAVLEEVRRLAAVIEVLNKELAAERSWRSRALDWILGGVVGAAISAVSAVLLGVG